MASVGYIRVSTLEQNAARQLDQVPLDKVFSDAASGCDADRPALKACLEYLREGDTLHVHSIDRLARNLADLLRLVRSLTRNGVAVHFHTERLIFNGDDSPLQNLLFQVVGACVEFERSLIRERRREGQAKAKELGVHCGRPSKIPPHAHMAILQRRRNGETLAVIAGEYGVSPSCIAKLCERLAAEQTGEKCDDPEEKEIISGSKADDALRPDGRSGGRTTGTSP